MQSCLGILCLGLALAVWTQPGLAQSSEPQVSWQSLTPAQRQRIRQAVSERLESKTLASHGDLTGAMAAIRRALAIEREVFGENHQMVADTLESLAESCEALGDYPGARAARQQVLDIRTRLLGRVHWEVTGARLALADCVRLAELSPTARQELKSADRLFREAGELRARGQNREAIPPVQQSLEIRRRFLGEEHRLVADALNRFGLLYLAEKKFDLADASVRQAATIRKRVLGEDHPDYAESLNNLATIALNRGQPGQAEELLKQAETIIKRALGEKNRLYVVCLHNLSGFYHIRRNFSQAEALIRRSMKIAREVYTPEDPEYVASLRDLATVLSAQAENYADQEQFETVRRLLWERQALVAMVHGDLDWRTTDARLDWSDANRLFRLEPEQRRTLDNAMAMLSRSEGFSERHQWAEAIDATEAALLGFETTLGRGNRRCLEARDRLGVLLANQGDLPQAEVVLGRSSEAYRIALGDKHPRYASTLIRLCQIFAIQKDHTRAEALARRALAILEATVGDRSPRTVEALDSLILVQRRRAEGAESSGDLTTARRCREEIVALTLRRFGETGEEVTAAKTALSRLERIRSGDKVR